MPLVQAEMSPGCRVRNLGMEKLHDLSTPLGSCGEVAQAFELSAQVTVVHDTATADAARRANLLKAMANRWPNHRFRRHLDQIMRTPLLLAADASPDLVWSKYSCGSPEIETKKAAQPRSTPVSIT
jgi:hypothetical protein